MRLRDFNRLDQEPAAATVRSCADIPSWAEAVVRGRPYDDTASLLERASTLARQWTPEQVAGALADHPRIGERAQGDGAAAAMSRNEQGDVLVDDDVQTRLRDGNVAYEQRFGHIYLVRAKGRSAEEILDLLEERLGHDDVTELQVTAGELREIAELRLAEMITA